MYRKRILSLLLAVVMMLGMLPAAFAAQGDTTGGLVKLNKTDFDLELTRGTLDPDREEYTHFWEYGGEISYLELEEADHHCHGLSRYLTEDSEPGEAVFTIQFPRELSEASEPVMRWCRFRPGDHTGDTVEDEVFEPLTVEDGSFSVDILEEDSPRVYKFQFGDGEDENFEPITYTYEFELSVQRFKYMTWDDVSYEITSGTLEHETQWPSTDDLPLADSGDNCEKRLYLKRSNPDTPVSAIFRVTPPQWCQNRNDLIAVVDGRECDLVNGSVEIPVSENNSEIPVIQFGVSDGDGVDWLTYPYRFEFTVSCLEKLTWDNVTCEPINSYSDRIHTTPGKDEPLNPHYDYDYEGGGNNTIAVYAEPNADIDDIALRLTVTPPESLSDLLESRELYVNYWSFVRGSNNAEGVPMNTERATAGGSSFVVPINNDNVYCYEFGTMEGGDFVPRTNRYDFFVDIYPLAKPSWDMISVILPDGSEHPASEFTNRYPTGGVPFYRPGEGYNFLEVPVGAPEGSKVKFKITCPDDSAAAARYLTYIKGINDNPDAVFENIPLAGDHSFTIDVDVIGAADNTKVIQDFAFVDEDGILVMDYYHIDFIAKTTGVVVNAPTIESGGVTNSAVPAGAISTQISSNPNETIYIDANTMSTGDYTESNVTLGSADVNAIVENNTELQISTNVGTVTLPAEAVEQAKGDAEDASVIMQVKAADGESVSYGDITVHVVKEIEVTLYRVENGGTPEEIPIRTADRPITVTVVIMEGLTLNRPHYLVYLPENGSPSLMRTVNPADVNTNSCITFTTPHLSRFALLTYEEARRLGVVSDPTPEPGDSGSTEPAERRSRVVKSSASSSAGTAGAVNTGRTSNGSVTASPSSASRGDTVTLTVAPDAGYRLESITVTGEDGKAIALNKTSDTVYTFTMPSGDVEIAARFVSDGSAPVLSGGTFSDVASTDWFAAAVAYVAENGMMAGNNGSFSPNGSMTRGMIAQVLYNMEKASGASAASAFSDVQAGDWFADAVAWAVTQGYMSGYGNGRFGPEDAITREQLATLFHNYAQKKGYDVSAVNDLSAFSDRAAAADWSAEAVRWAVGAGLLSGKSGGRLDPTGTASRAEVAQILMRFAQNIAK